VKAIWDYAKENGLNDGRFINSDAALAKVIGRGKRGMGEIARGISAHLLD
jgi:chromatin remodeling complex protein RSC6